MIDLSNTSHHPVIEELTQILCNKTQNTDAGFFKAEVAYFIAKIASCMRAYISTTDRGDVPVNLYVIALAQSGLGKGYSVSIMENELINGFKKKFIDSTMPLLAENHLWNIASEKASTNSTNQEDEMAKLNTEYNRLGNYPFTFDSGTTPAIKQLRQKLLLAKCGAINLQIDEIGSNLINSTEVLNTYLELYDQGQTKLKLVKNTAENIRSEDLDGKTPANMLLFGTPIKLFDGSLTEDQFYSFLEIGYARRCIFGVANNDKKAFHTLTAQEIFKNLTNPNNDNLIKKWNSIFTDLADPTMYNWEMKMSDQITISLIDYKLACEKYADTLPEHEEIKKAEICHRYFKALKLAGAFAFIDKQKDITLDYLKQAILLVEESGKSFETILTREKTYMKLAKYISSIDTEVTHADLNEALPFYKSSSTARNEMMTLATAWGYKQHILIKKSFVDGIEFFKGETLKETNTDKLILSHSTDFAYNYFTESGKFDQLDLLIKSGHEWSNHSFKDNHRREENAIPGFNLLVLDIDEGLSIDNFKELFKEYKYILHTTKRHTPEHNRFRVIIPINYVLELDSDDYKEFMANVANWLPFKTDESTFHRCKKWSTLSNAIIHKNDQGKLLDVLKFIPRTSKSEDFNREIAKIENMDNLERWFAQRIAAGNRNNQLIKYAFALVDSGLDYAEVEKKVYSFNKKLSNGLADQEITSTILRSVASKYSKT